MLTRKRSPSHAQALWPDDHLGQALLMVPWGWALRTAAVVLCSSHLNLLEGPPGTHLLGFLCFLMFCFVFFNPCICVYTLERPVHVSAVPRPEESLIFLVLELQPAVNCVIWVLGIEPWSLKLHILLLWPRRFP